MVNSPSTKSLRPGDRIKQSFLRKPTIRSMRTRSQKQLIKNEDGSSPRRSPLKSVNGNVPRSSSKKRPYPGDAGDDASDDDDENSNNASVDCGSNVQSSAVKLWKEILRAQTHSEGDVDLQDLLTIKIKASKFNYKDRISQQEDLIKKLRKGIKQASTRQDTLFEKADAFEGAIRSDLSTMNAQVTELQSQLEDVQSQFESEQSAKEEAQAEVEKIAGEKTELESQQEELKGQMATLQQQLTEYQTQLDAKVTELNEAHVRISEREHQLNQFRSDLEQTRIDRDNTANKLVTTTAEFEASIAQVQAEKQTVEGLITTLEAKQNELTQNRNDLQTQLGLSEKLVETAQSKVEELQSELAQVQADHAQEKGSLEQMLAQVKDEASQASTESKERASQLENMKNTVRDKENEVMRLQEQLQRANEDVSEAKGRYEKLQAKLDTREEQFTETIKSFNANQEAQLKQIASLTEDKNNAVNEVSMVKDENTTLLVEAGRIREEVSALRRQADAFTQEINGLREANEELVSVRLKLSTEVQFLRSENTRLAEHEAAVTAELSTIKENLEDTNVESLQELCNVQRENAILQQRLKEAEKGSCTANDEITSLREKCEELQKNRLEAEEIRRKLHNEIQELKGKVRVMARVRPLVGSEADGTGNAIQVPADEKLALSVNGRSHNFSLDHVFPAHATQNDVFKEVNHFVQSALDGYKVCLFAYGQTGSGKTYTMQGIDTPESRGMIPRAIEKILSTAETAKASGWTYTMEACYIEIYNETLRDLLRNKTDAPVKHGIKHEDGNTHVTGATYVPIRNHDDVSAVMKKAATVRSVAKTNMNDQSSRSHAVFTLNITGHNSQSNQVLQGSLNLVDLAGSERVAKSGATGDRLKEAAMINKSLSSLGDVFQSLAKGNNHIPFRNSKLTYLLQPCLSGEGKTLMLVNVAPVDDSAPESLCSLRFASLVNSCELGKAKQNKKFEKRDAPPTPGHHRPQTAPVGDAPPTKRRR